MLANCNARRRQLLLQHSTIESKSIGKSSEQANCPAYHGQGKPRLGKNDQE